METRGKILQFENFCSRQQSNSFTLKDSQIIIKILNNPRSDSLLAFKYIFIANCTAASSHHIRLCNDFRFDGIWVSKECTSIQLTLSTKFTSLKSRWTSKTTISTAKSATTSTTIVQHKTRIYRFRSTTQHNVQSHSVGCGAAVTNTAEWLYHFS